MHPTVKWCHVVCLWVEPIGHVTSVAGDNGPACPSRRGYTQLVLKVPWKKIANIKYWNPHFPRVTSVEIIGSNTRLMRHQVHSFYWSTKACFSRLDSNDVARRRLDAADKCEHSFIIPAVRLRNLHFWNHVLIITLLQHFSSTDSLCQPWKIPIPYRISTSSCLRVVRSTFIRHFQ